MSVGLLALQGDFAEHRQMLERLDTETTDVRTVADLHVCDRLIIPGGESTVITKLLWSSGLAEAVVERVQEGMPVYGTCAGAIVLASEVADASLRPLGLMDITVERNAYGRQLQSFAADLKIAGIDDPAPVSFIRAPMITRVGGEVSVLASYDDHPVLVKQGNVLVGTFHSEVRSHASVHELFLGL